MIRSAVLVSGKGTKLQSLLDSVFFGEIPELQLVAVISSDAGAYALKRARNAGIETVVVEPSVFPNDTSYDMAIRNKLKDMDIELVINAGFYPGIGRETAKSFRGKVIAVQPSLVPAFETLRGDAVHEAAFGLPAPPTPALSSSNCLRITLARFTMLRGIPAISAT